MAGRVRPHDLRARIMPAAARQYGSADRVNRGLGCDVRTARHAIDWLSFEAEEDTARPLQKLISGNDRTPQSDMPCGVPGVEALGVEPRTRRLKVCCSTS